MLGYRSCNWCKRSNLPELILAVASRHFPLAQLEECWTLPTRVVWIFVWPTGSKSFFLCIGAVSHGARGSRPVNLGDGEDLSGKEQLSSAFSSSWWEFPVSSFGRVLDSSCKSPKFESSCDPLIVNPPSFTLVPNLCLCVCLSELETTSWCTWLDWGTWWWRRI